jgi:hypothetical protein
MRYAWHDNGRTNGRRKVMKRFTGRLPRIALATASLLALGGCYYPPGYYGYYGHPGVVYDNGTVASGQGYSNDGYYADNGYSYGGPGGYYGGPGYYYPGYAYGPYYGGYYPWWPVGLSLGFGYGYYGGHGGHSHGGGGGHHH